jgi:arsenite methyltransferase
MPPRFIARQLSRPTGFVGRLIARLMNRTNAKMNAFAVVELELSSRDRVLEIGFGGGVTLATILDRSAFVCGVDRSPLVVATAKRRFASAVAAGRADFREGSVEALPLETGAFDKVCTVNTVYFWSSLEGGFAEIHRVLRPGGRVVVGFLPKERMDLMGLPDDIFTSRTPAAILGALEAAGFHGARIARPEPTTPWNVAVATRA